MTSEHLLDPELKPVLALFPGLELSTDALPAIREGAMSMVPLPVDTPHVKFETHRIAGPAGEVRVLSYRPAQAEGPLPAILHIHGGGFVLGVPEIQDPANRHAAAELGCAIFSVDYRLAPETPHPGPVEDCYAALQWLNWNAVRLGIDSARIGVMGESAGGGLAAGLALLARDRNGPPLAFQHLIYPMLDDRTCVANDPHPFTGEFIWTHAHNRFGWSALLGAAPGGADVSPYAAAARASDLAGLPPTFIAVGALDLFLEENMEYVRRLSRAGVPVELHVYPGAIHAFQMVQEARVSQAAERDSAAALKRCLHP